jgi:diaminohydroxyphosphoribosylaminopyrimidine deaminase / 5-amino-6-(5-phosphoribosylamino)uracil reductase
LDEKDIVYLERAMELAEKARGDTSPNPLVGALIVGGNEVLGEGYHLGPGRDHAEIAAIKDARGRAGAGAAPDLLAGTTMYVSLEPCCTYGRTPPCTQALIAAGFGRVVVGAIDPSPNVNGCGIDCLRAVGIRVDLADGIVAHRAKRQNDAMRKVVSTGLPFVTYKYAMTLDGRVATDSGDSRWISGDESRALVHQWRAWSDAVVVGVGTLRADDPQLTARQVATHSQPLRVVLDRALTIDAESALVATLREGPVLAVHGPDVAGSRRAQVESWGVETAMAAIGPDGRLDPREVGLALVSRGVLSVLLEGGPRVAGSWWAAGMIDKVAAFVCARIVSGRENREPLVGIGSARMDEATALREVEVRESGPDLLVTGYREGPF